MPSSLLRELLNLQSGVISRRQVLALPGESDPSIRRRVRRREWVSVHPGVYVDHTGPLTWLQRAWAATLYSGGALSHDSALRALDGPGKRDRSDDKPVHVAVSRKRTVRDQPGLVIHCMARFPQCVQANASPPRVRVEHAVLDAAAAASDEFGTIQVLADAVQARRTTGERLRKALDSRPRQAGRAFLEGVLDDITAGACSVLEQGYLERVERAHGLPHGERQAAASLRGPVYRDVLYRDYDQIIEIDGRLFHDTAAARDLDMDRDLDAAVNGQGTARVGWGQVFRRGCLTAQRVGALLQARGWEGSPQACPDCVPKAA